MRTSVVMPDKTVEDIRYVKRTQDTVIMLGTIKIGQIFKIRNYYAVVVHGTVPHPLLATADGFKTQYHCTKFALEALGYWKNHEKI